MCRRETSRAGTPGAGDDGVLSALTTALSLYLQEVNDDWRTCVRHERTASVIVTRDAIALQRLFRPGEEITSHVSGETARLTGWEASPFWAADGRRWESLLVEAAAGGGDFTRGVSWEGRPVLIRLRHPGPERLLALDLTLAHVSRDLPELPLTRVASGLRCHARLLPEEVAEAVPLSEQSPAPGCTVRDYLKRATPQGLYASQCFSRPPEGN